MDINRIVVILTPLVFAPAAGFVTAWVARNAPGLPPLDATQVTALFIAGATIAFGKAALWLKGWHQHMQQQATATKSTAKTGGLQDIDFEPSLASGAFSLTNGQDLAGSR